QARHAASQARDGAGELVAEYGRHVRDHHGVPAAQHLDIGAAGQRGLDPDDDLARRRLGHRHLLEAEIPRAVEDLSFHLTAGASKWPRTPPVSRLCALAGRTPAATRVPISSGPRTSPVSRLCALAGRTPVANPRSDLMALCRPSRLPGAA